MAVLDTVEITRDLHTLNGASRARTRQRHLGLAAQLVGDGCAGALAAAVAMTGAPGREPALTPAAIAALWIAGLAAHGSYVDDRRLFGRRTSGPIVRCGLTGAVAALAVLLAVGASHRIGYALTAIGVATGLTLVGRLVSGLTLGARGPRRTLVVGDPPAITELVAGMGTGRPVRFVLVGACLARPGDDQLSVPLPVYGDLRDVVGMARALHCDAVLVLPSSTLTARRVRRLVWRVQDAGLEVLLAPSLIGVHAERLAALDAGDRPLLHVRPPVHAGPQIVVKDVVDRVLAAGLVVVLAPVLLGIGLAIRLTSPGPALFHQRRVGRDGREFTCLKFRTMCVDADARRHEIAHLNHRTEGPLFKVRNDPRITRVGGFLRRSSLDELPQLFNVVAGHMSLVGPRPPLPSEVAGYDSDARRRLLVKPGLTGLWQVSGRSELPWPEAVRLDLSYVDNWSPRMDAAILARTAGAVVRGTGAY